MADAPKARLMIHCSLTSTAGHSTARRSLKPSAKITCVRPASRAELYEQTDVRRRIRVHDLRATFVTVSLANGASESWVADRTGHRSCIMINRYRRAARTFAELGVGTLLPLADAIPELQQQRTHCPANAPKTHRPLGGTGRRRGFKILGSKERPSSSLGGATS